VAADAAAAARQALAATVDVELPDVETYPTLVEQVKQGTVPQAAINDAVRRLLREKFELGLFEDSYVDPARADEISGSAEGRKPALEAARQAIVLLQNRGGLLPLLAGQARRVAVVGPHAAEVMLGGYSGVPRHSVSILEGIRERLGAGATVRHAEGVRITEDSTFTRGPQPLVGGTRSQARWSADRVVLADPATNRRRIAEAVALARDSDVVIFVVGDNEQTAREAYAENHPGDRSELRLVGQQEDLVRAVLDAGKPTVLVLINGRPPAIPELAERAPAILECWYPGQEGGTAVAEVRRPVERAQHLEREADHGDLIGHLAVLDVILFTVAEVADGQLGDGQGCVFGLDLLLYDRILPPVALREEPVILLPRLGRAVLSEVDDPALVLDLGLAARLVERVGGGLMYQSRHDFEPSNSTTGYDYPVGIQAQVAFPTIVRCRNSLSANPLDSVGATGFEPVTSSTPSRLPNHKSSA
jgi:hypothetical protein